MDDFYGPPLPPSLMKSQEDDKEPEKADESEEEADFSIGPTIPGTSTNRHYVKPDFSDKNKDKDSGGREEWMLSLPALKKQSQLSQLQGSLPTSFRKSAIEAQDDSWTKNPNTNEAHSSKRKEPSRSEEHDFDREYDREQEKFAKKSKKDKERDKKSLLDLHKEKLKKEKKVRLTSCC
jgi:hypothetical protein